MSEETQSFPKPHKKLRQLGVQVCSQSFFYYLHFDCTNELKNAMVWERKTVGAQASKAHVSRKSERLIHESVTRCVTRCYVSRGTVENFNAL